MSERIKSRVLIVDDNPKNIQVAANILNQIDVVLGFAKSGEEALRRVSESKYDLVLMDVMMPGMDGFETSKKIKENSATKNLPIIFVTAKTDDEDVLEGFYSGGVDYVTKPYKATELLARVQAHLTLKCYQDRLEERVKEETTKRIEQQELLVRQSRMAAMGEMLSIITHQWMQPLTITHMCLDNIAILVEEQNNDAALLNEHCVNALHSVNFMAQTIRDFKNYFSPNKHKISFLVATEIESVIKMLAPRFDRYGIKIIANLDKNITITGIPSEFKQVVLNLLSNAIDAITAHRGDKFDGEIQIDLSENDDGVIFEIHDNGGGIPEGVIFRVFDDYFTTKGEKGTGIGLSMSKMIIEESFFGSLGVKNEAAGAKFTIMIPKLDFSK